MSLVPVIIERIAAMGIPTHSAIMAQPFISRYNEKAAGIKSNFERNIKVLTDVDVETKDVKSAELLFGYIIQESITMYNKKEYIEIDACIALAKKKAADFLVRFPWVNPDVIAEKHEAAVIAHAEMGTTAKKPRVSRASGMSKKDRCLALYAQNKEAFGDDKHKMINLFMAELGLSKPGATTYEYNCRKEIWK